jgi:SAM-dependent methyltransferase
MNIDDPRAITEVRAIVRGKPFLRKIYEEWYSMITSALPPGNDPVLELGSGGGFLADVIPGLLTSEVQVCPHVRVVLDAHALPLPGSSLRAIVMTDVLHHLPESRQFFREATRCVRAGGRIVMVEPWVSAWSSLIYTRLHHEPFLPDAATWEFPRGGPLSAANMALPWIVFVRDRQQFEREFPQWRVVSVTPFMPFRYLLSGGVSMPSLMPGWTFSLWRALEVGVSRWHAQLGMFVTIILERTECDADRAGDGVQ